MPFYFGRRSESARTGSRLIQVDCDKCGCRYFYELVRLGTGSATAPYGIGTNLAAKSAEKQSERDLEQRLAREAELVPCPNCRWINEELVRGYRKARYRPLKSLAVGVGTFGTIISLICAWFISRGPIADRDLMLCFLYGGPVLSIVLAAVLISIRVCLLSRIRPNRNFPLAPKLPVGSPPALIENPSTGVLEPVENQGGPTNEHGGWIEFQIGRHDFPPTCCVCLANATAEHAYKAPSVAGVVLQIPRCADCARRSRARYRRIWCATVAAVLVISTGMSFALQLQAEERFFLIVTSFLVSWALGSYMASRATVPLEIGRGDASRGVVKLRFRNPEYGPVVARNPE